MAASDAVPPPLGGPLRSVEEKSALRPVFDPAAFASPVPPGLPGEWLQTSPLGFVDREVLTAELAGRTGGPTHPPFRDGEQGALIGETAIFRAPGLFHAPGWGALITPGGEVMESAVAEARARSPDLSRLPGVRREGDALVFTPPAGTPAHPPATVFMAFGGRANYGHFVLDCLPSLLAVEEAGLIRSLPPIAPPLGAWQRELLAMLGLARPVVEVRAPVVRLEEVAWAGTMHHFLHRPNPLMERLRARVMAGSPQASTVKRVYFSRRDFPQRLLVNEAALEAALIARDFLVIRPETLSTAAQLALMRGADVMVGPTGAAFGRALFAGPGTKVFEIQPGNFTSHWIRDLCRTIGLDWYGWFAAPALDEREVPLSARLRQAPRALAGRYRFAWRLELDDFLEFLDERM